MDRTTSEQTDFTLMKIPQELLDRGRDLAGRGHEVWLAGLGAFAAVEEEGTAFFTDLVKRGRKVEDAGKRRLEEVRDRIEERQQQATHEMEERVFQPMSDALRRFGVPTRGELGELTHKVDVLTRHVQMLVRQMSGGVPEGLTAYYVMAGDGGWVVGQEGNEEMMDTFPNKEQAVDRARELAHAAAPSRLHVYRKDGSIQDTFSYED